MTAEQTATLANLRALYAAAVNGDAAAMVEVTSESTAPYP